MEFDEKVQKVQKVFTAERIKRFAIASPELLKQSDYVKSLYMRMLCALMRCGSPTEEQVLFVQRLTAGAEMTDNFTELMRQSRNMDAESITAFLEALSPNDMKYYFVLDGCITCVLGTGNDRFAMLVECAEMLRVTEADLQYLARVAKAIVLQSSAAFDEAKKYRTHATKSLNLMQYLGTFYTGSIEDTSELQYIYSFDKSEMNLEKYSDSLKAKNIIIENMTVTVDSMFSEIYIQDHLSVIFRKCLIKGKGTALGCYRIKNLKLEECEVSGFDGVMCKFCDILQLEIESCYIHDCRVECALFIEYNGNSRMNTLNISNNVLHNCHAENRGGSAVLANIDNVERTVILNNKISHCSAPYYGALVFVGDYWGSNLERDNQLCTGITKLVKRHW